VGHFSEEGDKEMLNTKRSLVIILIMVLALTVAACTRSASQGPGGANPTTEPPVPGATNANDQNMGDMGTQTAVAINVPAVTQTPVPPTATSALMPTIPPRPATYKLEKGEFPYCLARRFDVNPDVLLKLNGLTSSSRTYVGQELKIPGSGSFPGERSLRAHPADYKVQTNDTIYSIACHFGDVYPQMIAALNGLAEPYTLTAGNTIKIP
jgi:LysM repeat protein